MDRDCLHQAVDDLAQRHAVLRTVVADPGTGFVQRTLPQPVLPLTPRAWPGGTPEDVARALLDERYTTADVCGGAPLFRPALHELDGALLLSFSVHHLVYDGWSLPVLWRDLSACYRARFEGRRASLPELPLAYADFARAQRTDHSRLTAEETAFWQDLLADCPRSAAWPVPRTPPAQASPWDVARVPFSLDAEAPAVREAARRARVSPFTVLLAATAVAVARVTGQHDLLFATDTANREDRDKRDAVGFYVNCKLTRVRVEEGQRFLDLVRSVWDGWHATDRYRDLYSDQILQACGSPTPLKVNMFNFSYGGYETPLFPEVRVTPVPVVATGSDWRDVSVVWEEQSNTFNAAVRYRPAHVDRRAAGQVVDHLRELLTSPGGVV